MDGSAFGAPEPVSAGHAARMSKLANMNGRRRTLRLWLLAGIAVAFACAQVAYATANLQRPYRQLGTSGRAHVVLALVEDSINAYHADFASAGRTASPSTWLAGYPQSARALPLHLHEHDLADAIKADSATWSSIKPEQLYYVPGTRLSGLVYIPSPLDRSMTIGGDPKQGPPRPIIDGYRFHGTGVASVAAGNKYGVCPRCDIVLVAADDPESGLAWAAKQPWIDIVSNSWGGPFGAPTRANVGEPDRAAQLTSDVSRAAAQAGKAVVFASGNGITDLGPTTHGTQHGLTWDSPYAGPPWVLSVGAAKRGTGQPTDWHDIPVDVIAQGEERAAANSEDLSGEMTFYGTSCSAPIAAGVLAEALLQAREQVHDRHVGPAGGLLRLRAGERRTYLDLLADAKAIASWHALDPSTVVTDPFMTPTSPAAFAYEGFGVLERDSVRALTRALLGKPPSRPEMDSWVALDTTVRTNKWGQPPVP
jgi:hypothetical protein